MDVSILEESGIGGCIHRFGGLIDRLNISVPFNQKKKPLIAGDSSLKWKKLSG